MSDTGNRSERAPVDWAAVRARIAAVGRSLEAEDFVTPQQVRAVLEARARRLASTPDRPREIGDRLELILFDLAEESYGIESRFVLEVLRRAEVALLPGAEPPVVGLAGWRGELLPVVDLRKLMGLSATGGDHAGQLVVLGEAKNAFGVNVDLVHGLRDVATGEILPLPTGATNGPALLRGTTNDALLVLDAHALIRTFA